MNATYLLHPDGGAITLLYYRGNIATPTHCTDGTAISQTNATTGTVCGATMSTSASPFGTVGNTDFDFSTATAFRNNFDRFAAYVSYPIGKRFLPMAGFHYGRDTAPVSPAMFPATVPGLLKFDSKGAFVEGTVYVNRYVTAGVRYDWFRPRYPMHNKQWAVTPYVNIPLQNGFQFIAEYTRRDFELPPGTFHRQNDTFQVRIIFIQ